MNGGPRRVRLGLVLGIGVLVALGIAGNGRGDEIRSEGATTVPRLTTVPPPPPEPETTTTTAAPATTTTAAPATTTTAAPATSVAPRAAAAPATTEATTVRTTVTAPSPNGCHPSYEGACVPVASDVDCAGGSGNGPAYVSAKRFQVVGPDEYQLDSDNDGIACES